MATRGNSSVTCNSPLIPPTHKGAVSVTSIDLSNFNTSKAITISGLFFGCSSLENISLNKFDINLASIADLFNGCSSLKNVALKVDDVKQVDRVFKNCNSLKVLDLSEFNGLGIAFYINDFYPKIDTANIIYNSSIFGNNLEKRIPEGWNKTDINNKTVY